MVLEKRDPARRNFILLIVELAESMQMGKHTDLILLDLSKAFDKVSHEKLLLKLRRYGIRGDILKWIKGYLDNRKQAVVIKGINTEKSKFPSASWIAVFSALFSFLHT